MRLAFLTDATLHLQWLHLQWLCSDGLSEFTFAQRVYQPI